MTTRAGSRPHAEFMRVWEEGYVDTTESFLSMHMQGVAVFEGHGLRGADGLVDRAAVRSWIATATRGIPYARLRLMRSPLGLTPPAWVPADEVDVDRHVRFSDRELPLATATLRSLIGWDDGPLDISRPLWRLTVTPLADGRVAIGILMHHSGGDALRTLKFLAAITTADAAAAAPETAAAFPGERAPAPGALPLLALRSWWDASDDLAGRWRAYWRRSLPRRARRVGARLARPFRNRPHRPAAAHSGFRSFDGAHVQESAEELGGTMNDVVVAATISAASEGPPVRVRVPVLRKRTESSRNRVMDLSIVGAGAAPAADLVASVRAQVKGERVEEAQSEGRPVDGDEARDPSAVREVGYATLVPWLSRARHVLGSRLEDVVVLPAGLPGDELSTFALLYDGRLSVTVTTREDVELGPVLDRMAVILVGKERSRT